MKGQKKKEEILEFGHWDLAAQIGLGFPIRA